MSQKFRTDRRAAAVSLALALIASAGPAAAAASVSPLTSPTRPFQAIRFADPALFFYDATTRAAGTGRLDASGNFINQVNYPAGDFGAWTQIVGRD